MLADQKKSKNADDFLKNYCGIILGNNDTGAITGKDAGGATEKTAESIVPETKTLDTSFTGNSFTVGYLTVKLGNNKKFSDLNDKEKSYWQALKSYWIEDALNLIKESYGNNFSFQNSSKVKTMTVTFIDKLGDIIAEVSPSFAQNDYLGKTVTGLNLEINQSYYDVVTNSDKNGNPNVFKAGYLDRNIAHELTHALMYVNVDYCKLLPRTILEGMAELTHGIDDTRKNDLLELAGNYSKLETALKEIINYTTPTIANVSSPTYSSGYMLLRYLAKQTADVFPIYNTNSNTAVSGTSSADYIVNNGGTYVTINGGAGDDTILNSLVSGGGNGNYALINAGDGNDSVYSSFNYYCTINGGNGNDTITNTSGYQSYINGGAGNDYINNRDYKGNAKNIVISGGAGSDLINGGNGNDWLYGDDGNDTLSGDNGNDLLNGGNGNDL